MGFTQTQSCRHTRAPRLFGYGQNPFDKFLVAPHARKVPADAVVIGDLGHETEERLDALYLPRPCQEEEDDAHVVVDGSGDPDKKLDRNWSRLESGWLITQKSRREQLRGCWSNAEQLPKLHVGSAIPPEASSTVGRKTTMPLGDVSRARYSHTTPRAQKRRPCALSKADSAIQEPRPV